eukprot:4356963-Prymnesium_polylepis.1
MQLEASATEIAHVQAIVHADSYTGAAPALRKRAAHPIGAPPAMYVFFLHATSYNDFRGTRCGTEAGSRGRYYQGVAQELIYKGQAG